VFVDLDALKQWHNRLFMIEEPFGLDSNAVVKIALSQ